MLPGLSVWPRLLRAQPGRAALCLQTIRPSPSACAANKSVNRFALVRKLKSDKTGLFNASLFDDMARQ